MMTVFVKLQKYSSGQMNDIIFFWYSHKLTPKSVIVSFAIADEA